MSQYPKEETIYELDNQFVNLKSKDRNLLVSPNFGVFNQDQTKCIITSFKDILFVNINTGLEIDIDDKEDISDILNVLADKKYFYVLANKRGGQLGYFLLMIEINHPEREYTYLINWTNKNNIKQADLNFMKDKNEQGRQQQFLVVSYKAEGINTYNVFVIDIKTKYIRFWFECYQLYESPIKGFLISSNDFMMLSKDGVNVINLGSKAAREVRDNTGERRNIRSLGSVNYLRVGETNHIHFKCQYYNNRRICIQNQYKDKHGETKFEDIYKIKVHEPTLRELLIIRSIYTC